MTVQQQMLQNYQKECHQFYQDKDIAISANSDFLNKIFEASNGEPFFSEDYRIGFVTEGEISTTINLIDYNVKPGDFIYIGKGSIVHMHHLSKGTKIKGYTLSAKLISHIFAELNFPSVSLFCKFFRRMAGCAPSEYRDAYM